ncbi:hypothetical protein PR048_015244 [Dryococelus australis]|uniref:Uncharacterized protein n=1 Tax=Dryococelus australis TaxID=614101 RepID=A0ABQ9HGX1_9NEOP|nr:hypothetical protein PR048_015244 [Dryococelus australis]
MEKLGEDNFIDVFTKFHDIPTKHAQDIFLQGLIDIQDIKRRYARKELPRVNTAGCKYHLLVGSSQVIVRLKAFISGFGVTTKMVRRMTKLKQAGETPQDKRGKSVSYSLPRTTKLKVKEHIESFPFKESHYCGEKMYYLSADLDLKTMHKLHLEKYDKVSYFFYRSFYRENFNYRFGRPQVDTCCTCEELKWLNVQRWLRKWFIPAGVGNSIQHYNLNNNKGLGKKAM